MRRKPYTKVDKTNQNSTTISAAWIRQADQEYQRIIHQLFHLLEQMFVPSGVR